MSRIKELVCDTSNIACFNKRRSSPKLKYIDMLFSTFSREQRVTNLADCSLYHIIDEQERYKKEYLLPKRILEAPAGIPADNFILTYALKNDAMILSNDQFKEYVFVPKKWLRKSQIKFMIINNQFIFQEPKTYLFRNYELIEGDLLVENRIIQNERIEV